MLYLYGCIALIVISFLPLPVGIVLALYHGESLIGDDSTDYGLFTLFMFCCYLLGFLYIYAYIPYTIIVSIYYLIF